MLILMMMVAANRKQQQQQQRVTATSAATMTTSTTTATCSAQIFDTPDTCRAIGKSSNSSNETVIARLESPMSSPTNSPNATRASAGISGEMQQFLPLDADRMLIGRKEEEEEEEKEGGEEEEVGVEKAKEELSGDEQALKSGERTSEGSKSRTTSRLKSFLLLTGHHLNPFHHLSHNQAPSNTAAQPTLNRKCSAEQICEQLAAQQHAKKHTQPARGYHHLNLFSFAQRYFSGSRQSADLSTANGKHQQQAQVSKSAPVTPVKWQPLEGNSCQESGGEPAIRANGYIGGQLNQRSSIVCNELAPRFRARRQRTSDAGETTLASLKSASPAAIGGQPRPSVRFVEHSSSEERRTSARRLPAEGGRLMSNKLTAERAVQTSAISSEQPDSLSTESATKETNIVEKLFGGLQQQQTPGEVPMDSGHFRQYGYKLIDYISNYLDTINERRVTPLNIEPGYLKSLIQPDAPVEGESFSKIMHDFENHIMCGITHWQHPHFHAYFPAGNAYPSILADMLSDALGCVGFSWAASPAYTELEIIMLDWMGKMIGLPDEFLCLSGCQESKGGGVIQGSASECVLVNLLAARHWAIDKLRKKYPNTQDGLLLSKLIGYCSKEAHSCVEKAAMIGFIRMRALDTDEKHSLRGETLAKAIALDLANGLEPFLVCATLGTTSCVSFDNLDELGQVCKEHDIWLHVDAAYAGSALICPEFKYLMKGIELASSFNMNPNKWMLINFDCSLMWVKDRFKLTRAFVVDPLYLQHSYSDQAIDYRHWGIPLSRRFRALKLWFVIRNYGIEGLQAYIRSHVKLAKHFEQLIRQDNRFTITNEVVLGLVCFRLVGSNALNQRLLSMINASGKLHMVPASLNGRYVIRFCVCDQHAKETDIDYAYQCISDFATELFESIRAGKERIRAISQQNTIDVSSISLHNQQSASADKLNDMMPANGDQTGQSAASQPVAAVAGAAAAALAAQAPVSPREAARQYLMRRNSRQGRTCSLAEGGVNSASAESAAATPTPPRSVNRNSPLSGSLSAKNPLTKQVSIAPQLGDLAQTADADEDLEQEIVLDSLATIDGYDYDLDDDDLLDPPFFGDETMGGASSGSAGGAGSTGVAGQAGGPDAHQTTDDRWEWRSPVARRWCSRASAGQSVSSRNQLAGISGPGEQDEAQDEVFTLAERRNRMSLRYKREFFVRVVSDPRVYRASISGDINAHSSCTSLGGGGQQAAAAATTVNPTSVSATVSEQQEADGRRQQQQQQPGNKA